jgi:hypothetical protein
MIVIFCRLQNQHDDEEVINGKREVLISIASKSKSLPASTNCWQQTPQGWSLQTK